MRVSSDGQAVFDIFKNTITITSRNTTIYYAALARNEANGDKIRAYGILDLRRS